MKNEDIEVILYKRPNMFRVNDNMYNMLGLGELENFYNIPDYKGSGKELLLFYPERFINIVEQKALIERLMKSDYKKVRIITHSPFIVQCSKNVKVTKIEGDDNAEKEFKLSSDDIGLPDDSGLGFL